MEYRLEHRCRNQSPASKPGWMAGLQTKPHRLFVIISRAFFIIKNPGCLGHKDCVPRLSWSITRGGRLMRLVLAEDWKPTGGLWRGAEGLGHPSFRSSQVSPAQILINVPSHLWALGAESLQFIMITRAVTREQVGVSMLRTRMGRCCSWGQFPWGSMRRTKSTRLSLCTINLGMLCAIFVEC